MDPLSSTPPSVEPISSTQKSHPFQPLKSLSSTPKISPFNTLLSSTPKTPKFHTENPSVQHKKNDKKALYVLN